MEKTTERRATDAGGYEANAAPARRRFKESVGFARLLLVATMAAAAAFVVDVLDEFGSSAVADAPAVAEAMIYLLCGGVLIFSASAHLLARLGYLLRTREGGAQAVPEARPDAAVGILIPSYREEPDVVRRTLLSAALQSHPEKWIALLLDDPPEPTAPEHRRLLAAGRRAPEEVRRFLAPLAALAAEAAADPDPLLALRKLHQGCAERLMATARASPSDNHEDRLFASAVLEARAREHVERVQDFDLAPPTAAEAIVEIDRLRRACTPSIQAFERRRYANLSHAANKAMNLNSAIALIRRRLREARGPEGLHLLDDEDGEIVMPPARYVVTLDADSVLAPRYVETLLAEMEAPGRERVAVAQTPYAATPDAPGDLERIAGATTDVQRILHQGYTCFDATFWVGANAMLRLDALADIRETFVERGHELVRFIQDRTVIEDTESTIDLMSKGWRLWNHPEILAWSATPPDFGALVIQRRRWACGGLLILPKALRDLARGTNRSRLAETVIRLHYLGSLAWAPAAVIALLLYPFDPALGSWFLPLAAAPYFLAYAMDLRLCGRSPLDIARVYGLNLLLIPVHLAGALASLRQAATGRHVPFQRTPKIEGRTAVGRGMLAAIWLTPLFLLFSAASDLLQGAFAHAAFAGANGIAMAAAAAHFLGVRATLQDLGWTRERRVEALAEDDAVMSEIDRAA